MLSSGFCNLHAAGTATQFHLRVSCLNGKLQAAEPRLVKNVKLVTVPMMYDRALQMILMNVGMMMYARALRMILMTAGMVMYEGAGAGALAWSITESHKPNQKLNRPLNPRHMKQLRGSKMQKETIHKKCELPPHRSKPSQKLEK